MSAHALDTAHVQGYSSNMQRRDGEQLPTKTPGRIMTADRLRTHSERATVRDMVLAGGFRRLTVKEMFDER
jgi:hypothetical protein